MAFNVKNLQDKIDGSSIFAIDKIWNNDNPSASFEPQTITVKENLSNYDFFAIDYCWASNYTIMTQTSTYRTSGTEKIRFGIYVAQNSTNYKFNMASREATIDGNNFTFTTGVYAYSNGLQVSANDIVPLAIYGIKLPINDLSQY